MKTANDKKVIFNPDALMNIFQRASAKLNTI
jgi:hypothetical protein